MKTWIKRTLIGLFATGASLGGLAACSHGVHRHGWHAMSDADMAQMKTRMVGPRRQQAGPGRQAQKAKLGVWPTRCRRSARRFIGNGRRTACRTAGADRRPHLRPRQGQPALIDAKVGAVQSQSPEPCWRRWPTSTTA
jgi:hypothetical protein